MTSCKLCARCCHYIKKGVLKRCKHLVRISRDKQICRIYTHKNRIGKKLDEGIVCIERKNSFFDYKDCPLNSGKQLFEEVVG